MSAPAYQAYYCEENLWHLAADPRAGQGPRHVALITNATKTVAVWGQRAGVQAGREDGLVVWDYHVVMFVGVGPEAVAWDLDAVAGAPMPALDYLRETFRGASGSYAPAFRWMTAATYRDALHSDRRHMRAEDGTWLHPPPPWPCIGTGHELPALLDLSKKKPGEVLDLPGLVARVLHPPG
ncbi:MAG: hypothetical protein AAGA54_12740 [Myxococcota bacterium]